MFLKRKKRKIVSVEGMVSDICVKKIKDNLENLVDVDNVSINLKKKCVIVYYNNSLDEILLQNVIEKLGYVVTGIKE